jgi:hypothetical protein
MQDFFISNFSVDAAKFGFAVYLCTAVIYVTLIYCTVWSINQQPFNRAERMSWMLIVLLIPLVGVLVYLPKAWYNAATGALSFWKKPKKQKKFYGY